MIYTNLAYQSVYMAADDDRYRDGLNTYFAVLLSNKTPTLLTGVSVMLVSIFSFLFIFAQLDDLVVGAWRILPKLCI